jgi:hypothetical protein
VADGQPCLFCKSSDGDFTSREHIFPETVGNTDLAMLPPGVVCDRCNNGPLARLDKALSTPCRSRCDERRSGLQASAATRRRSGSPKA